MKEGKNKLSMLMYRQFGNYFMQEGEVSANFVNTWAWNLICRSANVSGVTASALSWGGDCIGVQYGKSKTDPSGRDQILKHLFANPFQPEV